MSALELALGACCGRAAEEADEAGGRLECDSAEGARAFKLLLDGCLTGENVAWADPGRSGIRLLACAARL
jgi:hypothetical protein